jgi:hypothetical protein
MASASETPISPVTDSKPELTISAPSINAEPVELDSTPASPENVRNGRRASKPEALEELSPKEKEVGRIVVQLVAVKELTHAIEKSEAHPRTPRESSSPGGYPSDAWCRRVHEV